MTRDVRLRTVGVRDSAMPTCTRRVQCVFSCMHAALTTPSQIPRGCCGVYSEDFLHSNASFENVSCAEGCQIPWFCFCLPSASNTRVRTHGVVRALAAFLFRCAAPLVECVVSHAATSSRISSSWALDACEMQP